MSQPFSYDDGILHVEGLSLEMVASKYETPAFVYSKNQIVGQCRKFREAFPKDAQICFAMKSNSNPEILKLIHREGFGADVVSVGELELALSVGIPPDQIVFSGVGKTDREMTRAIQVGIGSLLVESPAELYSIVRLSDQIQKEVRVGFRVNPDVKVETHPHIATGSHQNKFGISEADISELCRGLRKSKWVKLVGVSCHLGSQLVSLSYFDTATRRMVNLATSLKAEGFPIEFVDMGGGLGIRYESEVPPAIADYAKTLLLPLKGTPFRIGLEPGRVVVGESGILLTRVIRTKVLGSKRFVIVDAAMNDLIRPALYGAHHSVWPVREVKSSNMILSDVVGPICESGDFLALDIRLPELREGDLLSVMTAGAYGYSMSSNYNMRPRPVELLVDGREATVIRAREKLFSQA